VADQEIGFSKIVTILNIILTLFHPGLCKFAQQILNS